MARRVFYSFHYIPDNWRAAQIRSIGAIEGSQVASDNEWETVTRGGESAIRRWIDSQMNGTSCAVILIGAATAGRKWIEYEIEKAWTDGKGVVGVYIHNLLDSRRQQSLKGANPFALLTHSGSGLPLSSIVRAYDSPFRDSKSVYSYIADNLSGWIDEAINIRQRH